MNDKVETKIIKSEAKKLKRYPVWLSQEEAEYLKSRLEIYVDNTVRNNILRKIESALKMRIK